MRALMLIFFLILAPQAWTGANSQHGQTLASQCVACHGEKGQGANPIWPKLAGQNANYLYQQMLLFKQGRRQNASMNALMLPLSDQDIADLSAYYAAQTATIGIANKQGLKQGEYLYRGGDYDKKITACIACHGPQGLGNNQANFPSLSGQYPEYLVSQLQAYKMGTRQTDLNSIMRDIASNMSESDMQLVANYLYGLH